MKKIVIDQYRIDNLYDETHNNEYNSIVKSDSAFQLFKNRFIDPWYPMITASLKGNGIIIDIDTDINDNIIVKSINFPSGFPTIDFANPEKNNVSATQHEAGHFICVPENRCVRSQFGFHGGVPTLGIGGSPEPTKPNSAEIEAQAMAWEIILMRDLHKFNVDPYVVASSLQYANDFWLYNGNNNHEKIHWVVDIINKYVNEFGSIDEFERKWINRCEKLPELFKRESIRLNLNKKTPIETFNIDNIAYEEWSAKVSVYKEDDITQTTVDFFIPNDEDQFSEGFEFDTKNEALKFIERVKKHHL